MDEKYRNSITDKFDNLEGVPPMGGWNRVKDNLPEKKKRSLFWLWIPFAAIFMSVVFLSGYFIGKSSSQNINGEEISMASNELKKDLPAAITSTIEYEANIDNNVNTKEESNGLNNSSNAIRKVKEIEQNTVIPILPIDKSEMLKNKVSPSTNSIASIDRIVDIVDARAPKLIGESNFGNQLAFYSGSAAHSDYENGQVLFGSPSSIFRDEPTLTLKDGDDQSAPTELPLKPVSNRKTEFELFGSALYSRKYVKAVLNDDVVIDRFVESGGVSLEKLGFDVGVNMKKWVGKRLAIYGGLDVSKIGDKVEYYVLDKVGESEINTLNSMSYSQKTVREEVFKSVDVDIFSASLNSGVEYKFGPNISLVSGMGISKLLMARPNSASSSVTNINFKAFSGIAFVRPLTSNLDMRIQPMVNYYFKDAIKEDFSMKSFYYGLRLAISKH